MVYKMNIAGIDHDLPLCRVTDDLYIGAFVVFGRAKLTVACARELLKIAPPYDYLITAEAKGIPLAHEMARQHEDETYFIARKYPKLYMTGVFEVSVRSISTDKEQKLYLDTAEAELMRGKRILIVDDVISTGVTSSRPSCRAERRAFPTMSRTGSTARCGSATPRSASASRWNGRPTV